MKNPLNGVPKKNENNGYYFCVLLFAGFVLGIGYRVKKNGST